MKITNNHNLPDSIYNTVSNVYPPIPNRFSVSDLINPPLVRKLKEEHFDELEQDASEMLWMLLGRAVHYILEKGSPKESLAEEKLITQIGDATIVGKPDLWHDKIISDFKITSVYSFLLGDKEEWEKQLNLYQWLYQLNGFETKKLEIQAILRDWQKSKAMKEDDYPKIPFIKQEIKIWESIQYADDMVTQWLKEYDDPQPCTDKERWARPTTWAVMKGGRQAALRVLNNQGDADAYKDSREALKEKIYIQERPGDHIRCKDYCLVRTVCPYNIYREDKP